MWEKREYLVIWHNPLYQQEVYVMVIRSTKTFDYTKMCTNLGRPYGVIFGLWAQLLAIIKLT